MHTTSFGGTSPRVFLQKVVRSEMGYMVACAGHQSGGEGRKGGGGRWETQFKTATVKGIKGGLTRKGREAIACEIFNDLALVRSTTRKSNPGQKSTQTDGKHHPDHIRYPQGSSSHSVSHRRVAFPAECLSRSHHTVQTLVHRGLR